MRRSLCSTVSSNYWSGRELWSLPWWEDDVWVLDLVAEGEERAIDGHEAAAEVIECSELEGEAGLCGCHRGLF